jgi:hypothetical protein
MFLLFHDVSPWVNEGRIRRAFRKTHHPRASPEDSMPPLGNFLPPPETFIPMM